MLAGSLYCHSCKHTVRKKSSDIAFYKAPAPYDPSALAAIRDKAPAKDIYILATMKRAGAAEVVFLYWMRSMPSC